ncbi:hypothetical protein MGSAQ_000793, partial [marine sediment metagenome]
WYLLSSRVPKGSKHSFLSNMPLYLWNQEKLLCRPQMDVLHV